MKKKDISYAAWLHVIGGHESIIAVSLIFLVHFGNQSVKFCQESAANNTGLDN